MYEFSAYIGIYDDMKSKRKMTKAQKKAKKEAKAESQKKYEWIFMNGKQVRVKRPQLIDNTDVDDFIRKNADPVWLHQNGMYAELHAREMEDSAKPDGRDEITHNSEKKVEDRDEEF